MEFATPNINHKFVIKFKDAPYEHLNNAQFDVSNIRADTNVEAWFGGTKCEITFDVAYKRMNKKRPNVSLIGLKMSMHHAVDIQGLNHITQTKLHCIYMMAITESYFVKLFYGKYTR